MINPFAEYRLYQPNISLFLFLGVLAERVALHLKNSHLKWFISLVLLTWIGWSNYLIQKVWAEEAAIYVHSLGVYPESFELYHLLGGYYEDRHRFDQAEINYLKAEELAPRRHRPMTIHPSGSLLRIYLENHLMDKSLRQFESIQANPDFGQIPPDYYSTWLKLLHQAGKQTRFSEVRSIATIAFPREVFPTWK